MAEKKSDKMKTKKKLLIGFGNCLLVTFEMSFIRVMKMT